VQIDQHFTNRHVTLLLDGVLFGQAVHSFDHSIGLGRVGQRCPMLDLLLSAEFLKVMVVLDRRAPAVLETFKRKLAPIIREDFADPKRKEYQALSEKVSGRLLGLAVIDCQER
jgi:hypothetical protein